MTRFPGAPEPKGLGTPQVESLTGYLQRVSNEHLIPPSSVFLEEVLPVFLEKGLYRGRDRDIVRLHARTMNGAGDHARTGVEAMATLTGRRDLATLSFLTVADVAKVASRGIVARGKRWCPCCWTADGQLEERYERKVWNLSVVEACAIHGVALMNRCSGCGLAQPAIASDVRVGVCSHCGRDLVGAPLALRPIDPGSEAARRLWYAEQAEALIQGAESVDLLGISQRELTCARRAGLNGLAAHLRADGNSAGVLGQVETWSEAFNQPSMEALFSALWQARLPVATLFPAAVQGMLGPAQAVPGVDSHGR